MYFSKYPLRYKTIKSYLGSWIKRLLDCWIVKQLTNKKLLSNNLTFKKQFAYDYLLLWTITITKNMQTFNYIWIR